MQLFIIYFFSIFVAAKNINQNIINIKKNTYFISSLTVVCSQQNFRAAAHHRSAAAHRGP
jgi:hypothetical protein